MALPVFTTVKGPVTSDYASGVNAFNGVALTTETNLDKWNTFQADVDRTLNNMSTVTYHGIATPATGWAVDTYAARKCWGRKSHGFTFIHLSLLRTGATIPAVAGDGGNIANSDICTLHSNWRPPHNHYVQAVYYSYAPCSVVIGSTGKVTLHAMAAAAVPFQTNRLCIITAMWTNTATPPYPL